MAADLVTLGAAESDAPQPDPRLLVGDATGRKANSGPIAHNGRHGQRGRRARINLLPDPSHLDPPTGTALQRLAQPTGGTG